MILKYTLTHGFGSTEKSLLGNEYGIVFDFKKCKNGFITIGGNEQKSYDKMIVKWKMGYK